MLYRVQGVGLCPWQHQAKRAALLYSQLPSGKRALLKQAKEWLIRSVYANHSKLLVIEWPVNYLRAGVILFAVYKQKDGVWLALRNAASEDNRFRALCTKACLYDLFVEMELAVSFGLIKMLSLLSNLVLLRRCWLLKEDVLHHKDIQFCLHCYSCINILVLMKILF